VSPIELIFGPDFGPLVFISISFEFGRRVSENPEDNLSWPPQPQCTTLQEPVMNHEAEKKGQKRGTGKGGEKRGEGKGERGKGGKATCSALSPSGN